MKKHITLISIIISLSFSNEAVNITMNFDMPSYIKQMPSKVYKKTNTNTQGSLFNYGSSPLFSDRKASNINDILTVIINETSSSNTTGKKKIAKKTSSNMLNPTIGKDYKDIELRKDYSFTQEGSMSSDGQGSSNRSESLNATINVRIIKILNNNNYFITGSKELFIDGEHSYIKLSGLIRAEDINSNNTITSNLIADAKIMYSTDGEISKATQDAPGLKRVKNILQY